MSEWDEEIQNIEKIILTKFKEEFEYVRETPAEKAEEKAPSIDFRDKAQRDAITQIKAVLWKTFKLSDVYEWIDGGESHNVQILEALDKIAKLRHARFLQIQFLRSMDAGDILFHVEVGKGWSNFAQTDNRSGVDRFYMAHPVGRGTGIMEVKKVIKQIWDGQEEQRETTFGKVDLNIEKQLWKDEHDGRTEIGAAQIKIARHLEKKESLA